MRYLAIILIPLLSGCMAAAGGAVGADLVQENARERQRYVETHERPERIDAAIFNRRVVEGMRQEEVRLVWGSPSDRGQSGSETLWLYGRRDSESATQVYFRNGEVAKIAYGSI